MVEKNTSAYQLYQYADGYNLSLAYRGPFLEDLTHRILNITENTISDQQGLPKINRKISFLLVECFQNIIKHGETLEGITNRFEDEGLFHFKNVGYAYIINSINLVKNEEVDDLISTVDHINSLDRDKLKEMYKQQLQNATLSEKGGAGLGLIEIARKSGQKLIYEIERIDDEVSYFHQQITFLHDGEMDATALHAIDSTRDYYRVMKENDLLLEYKGDFSQKSILPLLNIVETNMSGTPAQRRAARKVGHVLIESLQNISKHGYENEGVRDGIFTIGRKADEVFIQAANVVHNNDKESLHDRMDYLLSLSTEELKEIHREKIRNSVNFTEKTKSGLGLIEIAKASKGLLSYQFDRLSKDLSFFSLHVTV